MAEPVTAVFSRQAKAGQTAALEAVVEQIRQLITQAPGVDGVTVLRPHPDGPQIITMVAHFKSAADLDSWTSSPIRARLVAEADMLSVDGLHVQQASGLDAWFQMPGQPLVVPPPRYKMAAVTWLALVPLLIGINLIGAPIQAGIPALLRPVPVSIVLVVLMTWVVMPWMTTAFRFWLFPARRGSPAANTSKTTSTTP